MSMLSLASRASANSRSCARTLLTTTVYVSGGSAGLGGGRTGAICTGAGIVASTGAGSARRCVSAGRIGVWLQPWSTRISVQQAAAVFFIWLTIPLGHAGYLRFLEKNTLRFVNRRRVIEQVLPDTRSHADAFRAARKLAL